MGAIVCDLSKEEVAVFEELGLKIGLLFQIHDDIIDATKSSKEAGKPTNHDSSKNSFTNLLGVDGAIKAKDELKVEIEELFSKVDKKLQDRLKKMIDKYL
jgi:farnesyl diphosphate synthase